MDLWAQTQEHDQLVKMYLKNKWGFDFDMHNRYELIEL